MFDDQAVHVAHIIAEVKKRGEHSKEWRSGDSYRPKDKRK